MEDNKFEKREHCLYCNKKMEAKYRNKKFCSDKCRIYSSREKEVKPEIIGEREVFIPKNQPVLDKYGNVLVSAKIIKKENGDIEEMQKQFPNEERTNLSKENQGNEPKENTNRFFLKYGVFTYAEIKK